MGQLKQGTLSRRGTAKVCPAGASQPVNPAESLGPRGRKSVAASFSARF